MRKSQKKEILKFISTMQEAHEEIKAALGKQNIAVARDILAACQECAAVIGQNIEQSECAEHVSVKRAQEYCTLLPVICEEIAQNSFNAKHIYKQLKKQLFKLENSIKNDIKVKKEFAFFPYKASMWDALESIYLAAKADPDCDAYCVCIPYYDLKPDHSFGQMHYEGHDFPEGIEVIDWQTYSFEERRPDAMYIMYPYDNWNLVTSITTRLY